jgi:hypothetical protein
MADQTTDPLAKGGATTEGKLTWVAVLVAVLVDLFGVLADLFTKEAADHPGVPWLQLAGMACATILAGFGLWGYTRGRSILKSTAITSLLENGGEALVAQFGQRILDAHLGAASASAESAPTVVATGIKLGGAAASLVSQTMPTPAAGVPVVKGPSSGP